MSASSAILAERSMKGRRVLVIEDEYFLAEDIARELESLGAKIVGPIGDMKQATKVVQEDAALDGAIVDINLHGEMIFSVAHTLRLRQVPFVFASGYGSTTINTEFNDVPLWEKPIDIAAMVRNLAGMMK